MWSAKVSLGSVADGIQICKKTRANVACTRIKVQNRIHNDQRLLDHSLGVVVVSGYLPAKVAYHFGICAMYENGNKAVGQFCFVFLLRRLLIPTRKLVVVVMAKVWIQCTLSPFFTDRSPSREAPPPLCWRYNCE